MIQFDDGTIFNHCFCYMTEGETCKRSDCTGLKLKRRSEMIKKMYAVRDGKAECFHNPFFQSTHGEAERAFRTAVADEKTTLNQYPEDFDLYYLGEYDDNAGKVIPLETPQHIIKAALCVKQKMQGPGMI